MTGRIEVSTIALLEQWITREWNYRVRPHRQAPSNWHPARLCSPWYAADRQPLTRNTAARPNIHFQKATQAAALRTTNEVAAESTRNRLAVPWLSPTAARV